MQEFIVHITSDEQILNTRIIWENFKRLGEGKYLVKITSVKKRSLPQNAYYHGCVVPMVKEALINAGFDEVQDNNDAHEVMKHLFLKRQMVGKKDGLLIEIAGSTADLTTIQFIEYLEKIYKWSSEYLGTYIPPPGHVIPMYNE